MPRRKKAQFARVPIYHLGPARRLRKQTVELGGLSREISAVGPHVVHEDTARPDVGASEGRMPSIETSELTAYARDRNRRITAWADARPLLHRSFVDSEAPLRTRCARCDVRSPTVDLIHCPDCASLCYLCRECWVDQHKFIVLHRPFRWNSDVGAWVPAEGIIHVMETCGADECTGNVRTRNLDVVDPQGRIHEMKFRFCDCRSDVEALVRLRMWPASPQSPRVAFCFQFMEQLRSLYMECQVSVQGFCNALRHVYDPRLWKTTIQDKTYRALIAETFEEYRQFIHAAQYTVVGLEGTECPACPGPGDDDLKHVAIDACFGLVRKKKSGENHHQPRHGDRVFVSQGALDKFVQDYKFVQPSNKDCSDFKAGDNIRSRSRYAKLDETGCFGAICRHGVDIRLASLKHGERIAYSVFLLEEIRRSNSQRLAVFYDIACLLDAHLKRNEACLSGILDQVELVLPAFHAYAHCRDCQLKFSPRRRPVALTDGEATERFWSALRPFGKIVKEMTAAHRQDVLADAAIHYVNKMRTQLVRLLPSRLASARDKARSYASSVDDKCRSMRVSITDVQKWITEEVNCEWNSGGAGRRDDVLVKLRSLAVDYHYQLELLRKYANGQKIATRIQKMIAGTTKSLTKKVAQYNSSNPTSPIDFGQACDPNSAVYDAVHRGRSRFYDGWRRELIDELHRLHRAEEEVDLVTREMRRVVRFYRAHHRALVTALETDDVSLGRRAILTTHVVNIENHLHHLTTKFSSCCSDEFLASTSGDQMLITRLSLEYTDTDRAEVDSSDSDDNDSTSDISEYEN